MLPSDLPGEENGNVAHILPDTMPSAFPFSPGPPPRPKKQSHGWTCPGCGHSYAPWVPECHHCPVTAAGFESGPLEIDGCP